MDKPATIEEIKGAQFTWVDVRATTPSEMEYLKENFRFHTLDLKDCLPPTQRPKLVSHEEYIFMILLFPVFDRKTKKIQTAEIDFFISSSTLVTVHENNLQPLIDLFVSIKHGGKDTELMQGSPANLLYEILSGLTAYCFPILVHISSDIDEAEEHILVPEPKAAETIAHEILRIKTNIVNFRKATRPLKYVIERLITVAPRFFSVARLHIFFERLVEDTREIWDLLENYKDTIDALHETNESTLAASTNQIMKAMTVFAVTIIPATVIIAVFSTSFKTFPLLDHPMGFWIMLAIVAAAVFALFVFFKKKKWI